MEGELERGRERDSLLLGGVSLISEAWCQGQMVKERKYSVYVCAFVHFYGYVCHCEVAPVCSVIAADRGEGNS